MRGCVLAVLRSGQIRRRVGCPNAVGDSTPSTTLVVNGVQGATDVVGHLAQASVYVRCAADSLALPRRVY